MKKFLCVSLILMMSVISAGISFAEDDYVGFLTRLKTTPEEFFMLMKNSWATRGWAILGGDHTTSKARFYENLMSMQMALNRGDIDEMILPDFVAEYLLKINKDYSPCCISNSGNMNLSFGFIKKNRELMLNWNRALISMKNDNTLAGLFQKYVKNFPQDHSYDYIYGINNDNHKTLKKEIKFEHFNGAPTVKVAVTGDLPPVDFISEEGFPAGYNVAVLSEIGKRLRVNISLVNVDAGARTAALVSGRADIVFWYEVHKNVNSQPDVPDDVILSEPYLEWDKFIHVRFNEE